MSTAIGALDYLMHYVIKNTEDGCAAAPNPVACATMNMKIPTAAEVRAILAPMGNPDLQRLAQLSGVPFHTLLKVRSGETMNPRIDTVRQFLPYVAKVRAAKAA